MLIYDFMDKYFNRNSFKEEFQDYKLSEMKFENVIEIVNFIVDDLCQQINAMEPLQIDAPENDENNQLVKGLRACISDPGNYLYDLYAACYMSILYNDPSNEIRVGDLSPECRKQMHKAINMAAGKSRRGQDQMHQLTGGDYERYPVPLYYNDITGKLVMIPGGCEEFHKQVIHRKNFGFYDMSKNNETQEDYGRHAYGKIHNVWDCLRKSSIENLLMMEYNLGSGYACYLFEKLSWIQSDTELYSWKEIIELGREFPHFFVRKHIMGLLFGWLEVKQYSKKEEVKRKELRNQVSQILKNVTNIITTQFIRSLKLFSYLMIGGGMSKVEPVKVREEELLIFQNTLTTAWLGYYDNWFAYSKCAEPVIGKGWYCLDDYKECFYRRQITPTVREQVVLERLHEIEFNVHKDYEHHIDDMVVRTDDYYKYTIVCQEPCNPVGWELWNYACMYFMNNSTPDRKEDAELLFDQKLQERFTELKNGNEKRLNNKGAKANPGKVAANDFCKYGYIQRHLVTGYPKTSDL